MPTRSTGKEIGLKVLRLGFGFESRVFSSLIRLRGREEEGWSEAAPLTGQARRTRSDTEIFLRVSPMV